MTLIERLRELGFEGNELGHEAADEIERLRKALQWIADNPGSHPANMVMVARDALAVVVGTPHS